jgi:hypothetical protein
LRQQRGDAQAKKRAPIRVRAFAEIAKIAGRVDTLDGFLREMKARFPDASARATMPPADPLSTGSLPLPQIEGIKPRAPDPPASPRQRPGKPAIYRKMLAGRMPLS